MNRIKEFFYLFKVHHWIKNLIIFLPIIASHNITNDSLYKYFIYFLVLSILSSTIYLFNNIYDFEEDNKNKNLKYTINLDKKKIYYYIGILSVSLIFIFIYLLNKSIFLICLFYFFLSLTYNYYFKKIKYLDIFILALFHIIRIYYGSIAFKVELSIYFVLFCSAIFLMIGSNKRIIEIDKLFINRPYGINDRKKIKVLQIIFSFAAILIFLFYCLDPFKNQYFIYSQILYINLSLIVLMIINFLYYQKNKYQDIMVFIYKDKINFILVCLFFTIFIGNSIFFYD